MPAGGHVVARRPRGAPPGRPAGGPRPGRPRARPISSEITSIGSLPAKSAMKSNVPCSRAGSRCSTAMARMRSSIWATLDGGEALAHQRAHPGVPGRVEGQERHDLVGVGAEGAGVEGDAVARWRSRRRCGRRPGRPRGGRGPRSRARRCGRPGPRPAAGRRPGRDPRGSRRRTGCRRRAGGRWSSRPVRGAAAAGAGRASASAAAATNSGMSGEDMWPMPAVSSAPEKEVSSTRTTIGSAPGPTAAASRRWISLPIRSRRCLTSGVVLSRATVQASTRAGLSVVNRTMARTVSATRSGTGRRRGRRRPGAAPACRRQSTSASRWSLELK